MNENEIVVKNTPGVGLLRFARTPGPSYRPEAHGLDKYGSAQILTLSGSEFDGPIILPSVRLKPIDFQNAKIEETAQGPLSTLEIVYRFALARALLDQAGIKITPEMLRFMGLHAKNKNQIAALFTADFTSKPENTHGFPVKASWRAPWEHMPPLSNSFAPGYLELIKIALGQPLS